MQLAVKAKKAMKAIKAMKANAAMNKAMVRAMKATKARKARKFSRAMKAMKTRAMENLVAGIFFVLPYFGNTSSYRLLCRNYNQIERVWPVNCMQGIVKFYATEYDTFHSIGDLYTLLQFTYLVGLICLG